MRGKKRLNDIIYLVWELTPEERDRNVVQQTDHRIDPQHDEDEERTTRDQNDHNIAAITRKAKIAKD